MKPDEPRRSCPSSPPTASSSASYNPDDAVVFPWPFVWGYAQGAEALGVDRSPRSRGSRRSTSKRARVARVGTERGEVATRLVVNACRRRQPRARAPGRASSSRRTRTAMKSARARRFKPWLGPLVADLSNGLYFSQSMRGELVGGISNEASPRASSHGPSSTALPVTLRARLSRLCPVLGSLKIAAPVGRLLRPLAGSRPGGGPGRRGRRLLASSGFMGHGFMMASHRRAATCAKSIARAGSLSSYRARRLEAQPPPRSGAESAERMIMGLTEVSISITTMVPPHQPPLGPTGPPGPSLEDGAPGDPVQMMGPGPPWSPVVRPPPGAAGSWRRPAIRGGPKRKGGASGRRPDLRAADPPRSTSSRGRVYRNDQERLPLCEKPIEFCRMLRVSSPDTARATFVACVDSGRTGSVRSSLRGKAGEI